MSSYDKVVKLACKPKAAPPKAKYLEPIIAATWSDDGAVHDVCKALSPRFREPNSVVVFKALIVLHTMIRNGSTDNVLSYLSSSEVLRLRNVSSGNWDGYAAPENIQHYAIYLDSRIRAYRDLKHDAIRVQSETNRDMRNSILIDEEMARAKPSKSSLAVPSGGVSRSKTIMGRKLRSMTVEKGLLRETKAVHKMIDTLVECRFYMDDLEDELTIMALRMLVKDLLILFQAGNEGVINLLEHYFEMSHIDGKEALEIYRHFCKQTERVVEYLGVAKKLQNLLNVPIPNLKHAPVSLAGALQEYLDDPNFEQNRIEYKANKQAADRPSGGATETPKKTEPTTPSKKPETSSAGTSSNGAAASTSGPSASKDVIDFFSAIENEQTTMFNPQTNSPTTAHFHAQSAANPFAHMQMQINGQPFMNAQPTGFIQPQHTVMPNNPSNPFGLQPQATGHPSFASFLPQQTGMPGLNVTAPGGMQGPNPAGGQQSFLGPQQANFLQPQATGANPFRQSMVFPQATGMAMFQPQPGMNGLQQQNGASNPFPGMNGSQQQNGSSNPFPGLNAQRTGMPTSGLFSSLSEGFPSTFTPVAQNANGAGAADMIARPSSTPLAALGKAGAATTTSPPEAQPVKKHQTGTKNPFGPVSTTPPPMPVKQPTLFELSMGFGSAQNQNQQQQQPQQNTPFGAPAAQPQQPQQTGFGGFNFSSGALSAGATDMGSIASAFSAVKPANANGPAGALNARPSSPPNNASPSTTSSTFSAGSSLFGAPTGSSQGSSLFGTNPTGSSMSSSLFGTNPTGSSQTSTTPSINVSPAAPLQPQKTGFTGLKPFKPTSAFGASLMENLPTISEPGSNSNPTSTNPTGAATASPAAANAFGGSTPFSSSTPFTSSLSSTTTALGNMNLNSGNTVGVGLRPQMTGGAGGANPFRASMAAGGSNAFGGAQAAPPVPGLPSFATGSTPFNLGGSAFGAGLGGAPQNGQQQQQQQSAWLI